MQSEFRVLVGKGGIFKNGKTGDKIKAFAVNRANNAVKIGNDDFNRRFSLKRR